MRIVTTIALLALLLACTATPPAAETDASASPAPSGEAEAAGSIVPAVALPPQSEGGDDPDVGGLAEATARPDPALPGTPIGRATSTNDDSLAQGMVRVKGDVKNAAGGVGDICVVLGPRPRCAVLTAPDGTWVIDIPQGPIKWEVRFMRGSAEIALPMYLQGPFPSDRITAPALLLPH